MYKKLNKIQTELKAPKSKVGTGIRYKYRSCEDILEALKPLLTSQGLVLLLTDEMIELPNSQYSKIEITDKLSKTETGNRVYMKSTATLTDGTTSISTSAFAREPLSQAGMGEGQLSGATSSYSRKYALSGLFCIDDTEDLDNAEDFSDIDSIETVEELKKYWTEQRPKAKNKSEFDARINARKEVLSAAKK